LQYRGNFEIFSNLTTLHLTKPGYFVNYTKGFYAPLRRVRTPNPTEDIMNFRMDDDTEDNELPHFEDDDDAVGGDDVIEEETEELIIEERPGTSIAPPAPPKPAKPAGKAKKPARKAKKAAKKKAKKAAPKKKARKAAKKPARKGSKRRR
jgi:hypothetical protein